MMNANDYRQRDSAEILQEQTLLERLKLISQQSGLAWWEFDGTINKFRVSPEWETLTGYKAADVFPLDIAENVDIEPLIPDLIDQWCSHAAYENQRKNLNWALVNFLCLKKRSGVIEQGYSLQKKDGSIIEILVTVRSLWINGQLNKLVVQNRDVGKFFAHAAPTASTSIEVNPPSQAAKSITPDSIKATFAALTAIIISMLGMAQDLLKPIRETLGLLRDSVNVSKASSDNKIMDSLPTEKIAALESALKRAALYSDFASVAAYSPSYTVSPYPYSFSFFLKASKQDIQNPDKSGATVEDPATAARTQSHVALSPHRFVNGAEYAYSVPLAINDGYGRKRLFFVQLELNDSTEAKADNLEKATVELARQVSHILESATDDQTKAPNP